MMKPALAAATVMLNLVLIAGQAQARPPQAAATLPNAFGDAAPARPAAFSPRVTAPDTPTAPSARAHAGSEAALRAVVADAGDGDIDLSRFTASLAAQLRGSGPAMAARIGEFGALRSLDHMGQENGADLFLATFERARTQWIVGVDAEDHISALLFRRAPEED